MILTKNITKKERKRDEFMSKIYNIEIEEILQKVVKIKANSLEEALQIVDERYSNEEYILDYQDYKGTEII